MTKIYYKLVNDDLRSVIIKKPHLVTQYKIGEFVSSPIPETPLCVFETFSYANNFKNCECLRGAKIFKCEIKTKLVRPWIPRYSTLNRILKLMKNKQKFLQIACRNLPSGTICCKQVKLLEEVK
jgi:hypothetical protein